MAYVDEAGFAAQPFNRSAWAKIGETHAVTAKRAQRLNVMGGFYVFGKADDCQTMEEREWIVVFRVFDGAH
jgi:hypothetical protein